MRLTKILKLDTRSRSKTLMVMRPAQIIQAVELISSMIQQSLERSPKRMDN